MWFGWVEGEGNDEKSNQLKVKKKKEHEGLYSRGKLRDAQRGKGGRKERNE